MIRPINHDQLFLAQPAVAATSTDNAVVTDLVDTLAANSDRCVGMAANMIGSNRNIIIVQMGPLAVPMINPHVVQQRGAYTTSGGCLSLTGERKTTRYHHITVEYHDRNGRAQRQEFSDWIAQIIQHEVDHTRGILI